MKNVKDNNQIKKELFEKLNILSKFGGLNETPEEIIEDALQEAYENGYSSCEEDNNE